jgi:hypothetical protein
MDGPFSLSGRAEGMRQRVSTIGVLLALVLCPMVAAAQGTLAPVVKHQFLTSAGQPCASCTLETFIAGTSTHLSTYSEPDLAVEHVNTNPIVLNSAGRPPSGAIYLSQNSYKFVLKTSGGTTIWSQDQVSAIPGTTTGVSSTGDVVFQVDTDNTGSNVFSFKDGLGVEKAQINESGDLQLDGNLTVNGHVTVSTPASTSTITTTGSQIALATPTAGGLPITIFANNASTLTIQGIVATADGQQLTIYAVGAAAVVITDQDVAASAGNRVITGRGASITLPPGSGSALLQYDLTATRWRLLAFMGTSTSTITTTGTQIALGIPTGMGALTIFANNATLLTLQGITAGVDGQQLTIYSTGVGQVDLSNQDGAATSTNRIINGVTGTISLAAGSGRATLQYDATSARWRVLQHEQGAWITSTFAAGNYTASSGNWTLASGDVQTQRYWLRGRTLMVAFSLINTTVSATPANLFINNGAYGGFTASANTAVVYAYLLYNDNGAGNAVGYQAVSASDTRLTLAKSSGTWSAATDTTYAFGTIAFEVN